jgi:uncharacterized protein (TIGR00297 family)
MPPHEPNELLRKSLHIAFGLGAIALRWLPWWAAAAIAAAAVIGNWLVLHRVFGKRVARLEQGWDAGIILYPVAVLLLIVIFRERLSIAAIAWAILAFGDGFATIAGKTIRGPRLPWNRDKSWSGFVAFLFAGAFGGVAIGLWMQHPGPAWEILFAVLCAAIVESLSLGVDDNLTVPAAAATALLYFIYTPWHPYAMPEHSLVWIGINTALAAVGFALRSVNVSGALGGWILGSIIILAAGWPMYVALLAFFVIGSGATKMGFRRKAAAGLAQEEGGRRSFSHAFSNVGVATLCAIAFSRFIRTHWPVDAAAIVYFMGIASLATAAADTTASEIGQWIGRRAFLPLTLRRVPPGTEGAISIEGTLAGLVAGFLVAVAGALSFQQMFSSNATIIWLSVIMATLSAFLGSWLESVAGSWNRKRAAPVPNGVLNFFNTAVGAILFYCMARSEWVIGLLRKS